jgi:hypothetical protein
MYIRYIETILALLDEEAFYLMSESFDGLHVTINVNNNIISQYTAWALFCQNDSKFPLKYKAFQYYKQKG